jgi:site-specific DNA-methyltransferase (cytosine-N4-specific)
LIRELTAYIKPYIQPFERRLAIEELSILTGSTVVPLDGRKDEAQVFSVLTRATPEYLAKVLAYWEVVACDDPRYTDQVLFEATTNIVRNGVSLESIRSQLPFRGRPPLSNRRCLRYGTHGLHEYRGKFFPQLVRSLLNVSEIRSTGRVADPMCGSGTTVVEAITRGIKCLGADINPLSVRMARTKARLMGVDCGQLVSGYQELRDALLRDSYSSEGLVYFATLPADDQKYLTEWFSNQVLTDLDRIAAEIQRCRFPLIQELCWLSLSNIIRSV